MAMAGIEELEAVALAKGNTVKELKAGGATKEEVDAAVTALMAAKTALTDAIEKKLGTLAEGTPEYAALQAKLPPQPKPSKPSKVRIVGRKSIDLAQHAFTTHRNAPEC